MTDAARHHPITEREIARARRLLGLDGDHDSATIRTAYRRALHRTHPDRSDRRDATEATIELRAAYELLLVVAAQPAPVAEPGADEPAADPVYSREDPITVRISSDDTLSLSASREETVMHLLDAAHRLGEVTYIDASAGFLEVLVEFSDAPTASLALALQGRGNGETDVFCTIEPLSGGPTPPVDAVTRLLAHTLAGGDPTEDR